MINFKTLFGTEVDNFKQSSSNILDIFTETIEKLSNVNQKIQITVKAKEEEVADLNSQLFELNHLESKNIKVIDKLNSIFKE